MFNFVYIIFLPFRRKTMFDQSFKSIANRLDFLEGKSLKNTPQFEGAEIIATPKSRQQLFLSVEPSSSTMCIIFCAFQSSFILFSNNPVILNLPILLSILINTHFIILKVISPNYPNLSTSKRFFDFFQKTKITNSDAR